MFFKLKDRARQRVLIVDQSDDSRQVLRTVLERRGVQIYEADQPRRGLEMARRHHPDLIVLDLDTRPGADRAVYDDYDAQTRGSTALVVLGGTYRVADAEVRGQFVSKPYHYAPLIRKIEELLDLSPNSDISAA